MASILKNKLQETSFNNNNNNNNNSNSNNNQMLKPINPNSLSRRGRLKIADPIVAPMAKQDVPNHVLNTKIYAKLQRNQVFEVSPFEVHFAGFEVNRDNAITSYDSILKRQHSNEASNKHFNEQQRVKVINISSQVQRMVVLPPQTKYFDLHYKKPDRLVPGFALEITVIFKPDEYRYYNDAIKIFSEVSRYREI